MTAMTVLKDYIPEEPRDRKNDRLITLSNDAQIHVTKKGPNGFWSIHYRRGLTPKDLGGEFVTFWDALRAVEKYSATKNLRIKHTED